TITGLTPTITSGGLTKDDRLTLSGTVSDLNGVSSVHVFDGSTDLGAATIDASCNWSLITSPLSEGTHSFTATATDIAGNTTTTAAVTATIDITAPAIAINATLMGDNIVNASEESAVIVSGTTSGAEDGQVVTVTLSDGTHTTTTHATVSGGAWTATARSEERRVGKGGEGRGCVQ